MGNPFIPFPRNENIIIVGDRATEILAALRIFGQGLIGGEVPAMELLHPDEKHLECIACFLNNPHQILAHAVKKLNADYVVLEANGLKGFDPSTAEEILTAAGIRVKVLDVKGTVDEILRRAGSMFGEERQAERVIREYHERDEALKKLDIPRGQRGLILLSIRSPIKHESYVMRVAAHSDLSRLLSERFGVVNVFESSAALDQINGIQELGDITELLKMDPDFIAFTGDAAAGAREVRRVLQKHPELQNLKAVREGRMVCLPYYCDALSVRAPTILENWADALME